MNLYTGPNEEALKPFFATIKHPEPLMHQVLSLFFALAPPELISIFFYPSVTFHIERHDN